MAGNGSSGVGCVIEGLWMLSGTHTGSREGLSCQVQSFQHRSTRHVIRPQLYTIRSPGRLPTPGLIYVQTSPMARDLLYRRFSSSCVKTMYPPTPLFSALAVSLTEPYQNDFVVKCWTPRWHIDSNKAHCWWWMASGTTAKQWSILSTPPHHSWPISHISPILSRAKQLAPIISPLTRVLKTPHHENTRTPYTTISILTPDLKLEHSQPFVCGPKDLTHGNIDLTLNPTTR